MWSRGSGAPAPACPICGKAVRVERDSNTMEYVASHATARGPVTERVAMAKVADAEGALWQEIHRRWAERKTS